MKRINLWIEGVRVAFGSLLAHRMRTLLTTLGVAIGIFAITIIFTLVNSLNYGLNKNLSNLGSTMLFVLHVPWSSDAMNWQKYYKRPRVSYNEYLRLERNLEHVDGVAFDARISGQTVKYKRAAIAQVSILAITKNYLPLNDFSIESGRPFTEIEVDAGRPVCIIGSNAAKKLFGKSNPLGKRVRLKGKKVTVIGVLAKSGENVFGSGPDNQIMVPYGFAARVYKMDSWRIEKTIRVRVSSPQWMAQVENNIVGLMRAERGLRPSAENDFEINRPEMLMAMFGEVTDYLRLGGIVISLFSIIVGGFGIGNIMFSTVKERTFEIGVQKALGGTRGFILFQFLMESIILCLLGGLIGLGLNYGVTMMIQAALNSMEVDFEMVVSVNSIIFGVILSVLIGLVSGYIPSSIAAKMDPVESMRT